MKTMKQFTEEWNGCTEYGCTVNRCFSFKPWFGEDEGKRVFVAAEYKCGRWEAVHAEYAETGEPFEMVCTNGESKNDLIDMIIGC
nr:MAG TPA: hypothetical protein [Caudoviricetes sp.]